ncbi:uncharacterized protein [Coffea arabica]|uniref:Uncharacterized protein isoform X2 n=1 Tax=Coffea arabica TaxID=13443 RepID=A0ABM4V4V3_COFAR
MDSHKVEDKELEFRPEDSIHFEKYGVSAASVEAEPCVVDIESSNNERWSSYNFPWGKGLEEFSGRLFGNFSLGLEQREVINATMSGRDVFAVMSVVEGSEVTYQLSALLCPGMTLVVVPLPSFIAHLVEHPVLGKKSMDLFGLRKLTERQRIREEHVTERCEFKLLYVTADDTITESKLLLEHLETLYDRGLLARIFIEEVQSVCKRDNRPDYQGLGIFKQKFPTVPLVALASSATDSVRDEVVDILGLVNCIHFKQRLIRSNFRVSSSKQSKRGKCGPTSPKRSLTIEKQNSFGSDSADHNIVDEDLCHDSHVGVESMDLRVVVRSWVIEKSKIGKRQRRQTKLLEELCLLNSIYGENFLLDFNSGIDISIPLRVLLSKDLLKDERTILKINWTETQVGIHIEPRDGVNDPLTFYGKLQSAEQEHIEGSIKALLNAVREAFNFGEIPIMVGHIIYPKYKREYIEIKILGKGSFGSVYECKVKLDDMSCAIKKIRFAESEKEVQSVINEVKMLCRARHQNVVDYYQAWIEDYREPKNLYSYYDSSSSFGPREKMMYIHMELCKESLEHKLAKEKELHRHMVWSYFRQILEALQYIHGKDLIHRDLKMDNIFIDDIGTVKIGDFGLAMLKDVRSTTNSSPVGAYLYRAPEMKKGECITNKVDMYALGLILFQLFCPRGCSVIQMLKQPALRRQVFKMYKVDETTKRLILELLQTDPLKRPSAADLLQRISSFR